MFWAASFPGSRVYNVLVLALREDVGSRLITGSQVAGKSFQGSSRQPYLERNEWQTHGCACGMNYQTTQNGAQ